MFGVEVPLLFLFDVMEVGPNGAGLHHARRSLTTVGNGTFAWWRIGPLEVDMKFSFVSLIDPDSAEPESLETWTMNDGAVALAYTSPEKLRQGVATSQGWRGEATGVGVTEFEASNEQELLLLIEQSGLFGSNLVLSVQELEQLIRETGRVAPYVLVAREGEPLFERTYGEWIR